MKRSEINAALKEMEAMAKKSIRLLLDVIAENQEHQQIVFPAELIERESTAKCVDE